MRARGHPGNTRVRVHVRTRAGNTCVSARGRIGRFVRGLAIHEFIRGRICTWQPELLVIKTRRSPFAPSSPIPPGEQSKSKRFSGRRRRRRRRRHG